MISEAFKVTSDDWQLRMNDVLREWVDTQIDSYQI
jgi:uncharacterized protein (DUF4415 family)